jgi:vacuolar-type H+-ATPase subunit C/Vma6
MNVGISVIVFFAASVAAISVFVARTVTPLMPFLYSNAVLQSRSRKLISEEQFSLFSESESLSDLISALIEKDFPILPESTKSMKAFHLSAEKSFVESVFELKEISSKKLSKLFDAYLMFWEGKIIKTFYRSRFTGLINKSETDLVFSVGSITSAILEHLKKTKTAGDMKTVLLQTRYSRIFDRDYATVDEFEVELDRFIFDNFSEEIRKTKMYDAKCVAEILNTKFDILNLLALIKAETRGIPPKERLKLVIQNNTQLSRLLPKITEAKSIDELVSLCRNEAVYSALNRALEEYKKDKSLSHFEKQLYLFYKNFVQGEELKHTLGPYPIFAYLTKKEIEYRNLLSISRGIDAGFSKEEIMGLVI